MLKKHPLMFRFIIVILFPLCLAVAYLYSHFKSSVVPIKGQLSVSGLDYPVEITHDHYGTPSIVAKTDHDAYFALGFKQAGDRLWQLEVQRRLAQGRLSEVFGVETLSQDILMRNFGLHDAAQQSLPYLKENTISALTAYVDGINAGINQALVLPIEFQLFGIEPESWTLVDILSWQKVFAMMLSGNMEDELRRVVLQNRFTPNQMQYFYPYDPGVSATATRIQINSDWIARLESLIDFGVGHKFAGSNAWVVSGKYTQSGAPMLANDPHLGLQIPSLWYAASLKGDKLNVAGMTLVGLPAVVFGKNADIAWAGTRLMADQQDLFIETTSPKMPNKYLNGKDWKKFDSRSEKINVSADFPAFLREKLNPVEIVVRKTDRGPVISDLRNESEAVVSLRWAALDAEDNSVDALIGVQYAKNWSEFRESLAYLKAPGLNYLYADNQGNIGHQVAGMIPVRGEGVGIIPLVASGQNDWKGYCAFDALPSVYNPESGFIVSANEQIDHSPNVVISHEWAPKARHERISSLLKQLINSNNLIAVSDMQSIQMDKLDLTAVVLLPSLLQVTADTSQEKEALAVLSEWKGEFASESVGATLFAVWSYYLTHEIFDSALHHSWQRPMQEEQLLSSLELINWKQLASVLATDEHGWCKPNQASVCAQELRASFKNTLQQLKKISGTKVVSKWKWNNFNHAKFVAPGGVVNWLTKEAELSMASQNSINAANLSFDPTKGFTQSFGSSFRQIIELDKKPSHWYMNSTGQSGNIMSGHYDDMITPFSLGQLAQINTDKPVYETLSLIPFPAEK